MKLYKAKIPVIAKECIAALLTDGDIEIATGNVEEAELDLVSIMEEFYRRDMNLRTQIKDTMHRQQISYDQYGKVRGRLADRLGHPTGDDVERFLCRQFVENLMISPFIEEVWADDSEMYKKLMGVLQSHDVDERAIREEAANKLKNLREGTVDYEIALENAIRDEKKRRGLIR